MKITLIEHNSSEYWKLVELRDLILRKPLNLSFTKQELLDEEEQFHFAVFENNKIVASLILVNSSRNNLKMRQVCVATSMHRFGIGKKLVLFAEEWARQNNYNSIYCHARKNALDFYNNLEYKVSGNSFLEVGLEHFKLSKKL